LDHLPAPEHVGHAPAHVEGQEEPCASLATPNSARFPRVDASQAKRNAANDAVMLVEDGMTVGLGTGSTAALFIAALAARMAEGLSIRGVATSEQTAQLARQAGIPLVGFDVIEAIDLTVDGADEITGDGSAIKGGGGALLREKIVAAASTRMVVIADESKWVPVLGRFPLPIEVMPFGLAATRRAVEAACAAAGCPGPTAIRKGKDGQVFVTDGGHWILDGKLERIGNPAALAQKLSQIPGVVEHGLFIGMAQACILAGPAGARVVERP